MFVTALFFFLCYCVLPNCGSSCFNREGIVARLPGDIIIGGLFAIHTGVSNISDRIKPDDFNCSGFYPRGFIRSLAMIHTIERFNNLNILPGITLGYEIYDTCADATKGLQGTMRFIAAYNSSESMVEVKCNYTDYVPSVKVVVGAGYSEVSIAVARLLSLYLMPQISYSSTAEILSDKMRFPSFLRTVPSDKYQIQALFQLISAFQWNWIGIIASDDDYGQSAAEDLQHLFDRMSICIAFREVIPAYVDHPQMQNSINNIIDVLNKSSSRIVVLYAKGPLVIKLFTELMKYHISRTWIASGVWSTDQDTAALKDIGKIGPILGFSYKNGEIDGFNEYLQNLQPGPNAINTFIEEYKELRFGCTEEYSRYKNCTATSTGTCSTSEQVNLKSPVACSVQNASLANDDYLVENIELGGTYGAYLAVAAVTEALKNLLCINGSCDRNFNFPSWQLLSEIKQINVPQKNIRPFYFDAFGDSINGYDLVNWQMANGSMDFKVIGTFEINGNQLNFNQSSILWDSVDGQVPQSNCSKSCLPGYYKKHSNITCCYECIPCAENSYSVDIDGSDCKLCSKDEWSNAGSPRCVKRTIEFFSHNNAFAIVLICFAAFGFLTVLAIGVIFMKHLDTPAVKAAGGIYSCIMNVSLLISFASTQLFIGEPSDITCQASQTLYGISFTLCVSCVLLKSLRIVLAFEFGNRVRHSPKVTYQPSLVIIAVTATQGLICMVWLLCKPPLMVTFYSVPKQTLLQCTEGSQVAFGIMLGYIGLLAFVCFVVAFKGRHLPGKYNEARVITFSMLIYLFVWIAFIPIYVATVGVYVPAVQVVAILASNYGIIFCHLLPTCYIIFFKQNSNNREKYLQSIHKFYKSKRTVLSVSELLCDPDTPSSNYPVGQTNDQPRSNAFNVICSVRKRRGSW